MAYRWIILVGALSAAAPAAAQPPKPKPTWLIGPSGAQMSDLYPKAAMARRVQGDTAIRCRVTYQGLLYACAVLRETPTGFDFGAAAIAASADWRMTPPTDHGVPVEDVVTVPIRWRLAGVPVPPDLKR